MFNCPTDNCNKRKRWNYNSCARDKFFFSNNEIIFKLYTIYLFLFVSRVQTLDQFQFKLKRLLSNQSKFNLNIEMHSISCVHWIWNGHLILQFRECIHVCDVLCTYNLFTPGVWFGIFNENFKSYSIDSVEINYIKRLLNFDTTKWYRQFRAIGIDTIDKHVKITLPTQMNGIIHLVHSILQGFTL